MPWISLTTTDTEALRRSLVELERDSDRAAGIVGAVLVEESLTALLQSRLWRDEGLIHELFRSSGPLGAFSVKINMGFLMGLYSAAARKELETIKDIRNEFAHRVARSFAFVRIRDLANNLSISEQTEFHISQEEGGQTTVYLGAKPPADRSSVPVLPPMAIDKIDARERYLRACQFYSGALLFAAHAIPLHNPPAYF
jgi:hypothetical protein